MTEERHKTTIYLSEEMVQQLRELSEKHHRSLNGEMVQGLQHYLETMQKAERRKATAKNKQS